MHEPDQTPDISPAKDAFRALLESKDCAVRSLL